MHRRAAGISYTLFYSLWSAVIATSFLYLSGLMDSVGTAETIPYVIGGLILGSFLFSSLSTLRYFGGLKGALYSGVLCLMMFAAVYEPVHYDMIVTNGSALLFSLLCMSGNLLTASVCRGTVYSSRRIPSTVLLLGTESLLMTTVLLSFYIALFYRFMPLIIIASTLLSFAFLFLWKMQSRPARSTGAA